MTFSLHFVCDMRSDRVFVVDAEISGTSPQRIMSSLMDKCCSMNYDQSRPAIFMY